jgi:hypothetical protein
VSLVVDRIGHLSARFLGESLVYILRENSGRTEELIGYWVIRCGISLFIRITWDIDIHNHSSERIGLTCNEVLIMTID